MAPLQANGNRQHEQHDSATGHDKEALAKKCTLKLHENAKDKFDSWQQKTRQFWPCPEGGFKGSQVAIFWDIENCAPEADCASSPIQYAEMLEQAFLTWPAAARMRCVASLSCTYQTTRNGKAQGADARLGYEQLISLNSLSRHMYVLTAPGKREDGVHKALSEADNQLQQKMQDFLSDCKAGDVMVVISGDGGFYPYCERAKNKGVNVIVMGSSLNSTNYLLLSTADLFMSWPVFIKHHGRQKNTNKFTQSPALPMPDIPLRMDKRKLAERCTLEFHKKVGTDAVRAWQQNKSHIPCPRGGFKEANVTIFWDIEECRPDPEYAALPVQYVEIFREAFKIIGGASKLHCIASLPTSYSPTQPGRPGRPEDMKLDYTQLTAMNSTNSFTYVLSRNKRQGAGIPTAEAEDSAPVVKLEGFLHACKPGDVLVVIGGQARYAPYCQRAKALGVNVVVMGPSFEGTSIELMAAANHWMHWPTFAKHHGSEQNRPKPLNRQVQQLMSAVVDSHVQLYHAVKNLDFVCLIDVTNSMDLHIDAVRETLGAVIEQISARFPWAKKHIRMTCIGYRDFMRKSTEPETEPFVWYGAPNQAPSLGDPQQAHLTVDRMKQFLASVKAVGGGDTAEDVLGGLLKVSEMLKADGHGRNCVLFHICDDPQHGVEFNDYHEDELQDAYPEGPLQPLGLSIVPDGRTKPWKHMPRNKPWMQEAEEVLRDLKDNLKVSKYVILQRNPLVTKKMISAFQEIVGDPSTDTPWTWDTPSKAQADTSVQEPWIVPLCIPSSPDDVDPALLPKEHRAAIVKDISNQLGTMMVATTLATISSLSKLIYDEKQGLAKPRMTAKTREFGSSVLVRSLKHMQTQTSEQQEASAQAVPAINADAVNGTTQTQAPAVILRQHVFDDFTKYRPSHLDSMAREIKRQLKKGVEARASQDIWLFEPLKLDELIQSIHEGAVAQREAVAVPPLLQQSEPAQTADYFKQEQHSWQGEQRFVYEAVRNYTEKVGNCRSQIVAMKEFKKEGQGVNTKDKYIQMCHNNMVASFLAKQFNAACISKDISQVNGKQRMDLVYMPMWTTSYDLNGNVNGRRNFNVEPFIIGEYIKYNSNTAYVNMATLTDVCQAFSHWTYEYTKGYLMVTDVQGVKDHQHHRVLLTDPAIHCVPMVEAYFDPKTNRGPIGVKEFFMSHTCNDTCKKLGLRAATVELAGLRADALAGRLPEWNGKQLNLDDGCDD